MLAFIEGELVRCDEGSVLINCGGVGLRVLVPEGTQQRLPAVGNRIRLWTAVEFYQGPGGRGEVFLFGFLTEAESTLFELLRSVSGIGAKTALAILSAMSVAQIRESILRRDIATLQRLPGVGRKTAERMVLELQGRIQAVEAEEVSGLPAAVRQEALAALVALGYSRSEAERMVREALHSGAAAQARTAEELIKAALQRGQR